MTRSEDDEEAINELFVTGESAVPSLLNALRGRNKELRVRAGKGIAYIGTPQGIEALHHAIDTERNKETKAILAFFLAGRLVQSTSKADVDFLISSINKARTVKDSDDEIEGFPAVTAVLTLGLMGKSEFLPALRTAAQMDMPDSEEVVKAIDWIEKKSGQERPVLSMDGSVTIESQRIKGVLDQTFFAQSTHASIDQVIFSNSKDEALVLLSVGSGGRDKRGYDLVLTKARGEWRVAGAWFSWIS